MIEKECKGFRSHQAIGSRIMIPDNKMPIEFTEARQLFESGNIFTADTETLRRCIRGLANQVILNENVRHQAIVMSNAITQILMERTIELLESRNKSTKLWFMILAIGSLLVGALALIL